MNLTEAIKATNLHIAYGPHTVLENASFEVSHGDFVGIVGKSGTGKTSLLNAIAGFIATNGTLQTQGSIGFCFQNHSLFYWLTVAENIAFGLNNHTKKEKKEIVQDVLQKIGLVDHAHKYPSQLSGGQMQRVALGRAIAYQPAILLLDEPFSSLDMHTRDQMIDWVLQLINAIKITVMMVTHYLDEALILANRIFVLQEKKIGHDFFVPFDIPRNSNIRFTDEFQQKKLELTSILNT